ncbi:HNH endonuclease [Chryseobacterium taeanense]|uniref:HNH endonuclease n=1 Tax=Chryseobacterium taeanense TaxID=311334 RepID=A0A1G8KBX7_9FLAO|nr:HNH endonuclease [Chryseobacterium taeanense]SDI40911.1 HNH endonuclease [Chryseobacterium taeanense]
MITTQNFYIQYHNADKLECYPTENTDFKSLVSDLTLDDSLKEKNWIYTTKKTVFKAKGSICFLIVGKTENKIKNYYLWCYFTIKNIEENAFEIVARGKGKDFKHPIILNNLENFDSFKKFCGNFGIGFQKIDNHDFSKTLSLYLDEIKVDYLIPDRKVFLEETIQELNNKMLSITPERKVYIIKRLIRKDSKMVKLLKEYVGYKCQFPNCNSHIPHKKYGVNYVEVAHIKAVADDGQSTIGNLIVLCPNHHKEFDLGERNIFVINHDQISGRLNENNFEINLFNNYSYKIK